MADYRQSLQTLSRAPLASFVAERTRLAAALRAAGDEEGAKQLTRRRRPTASAWTVNQLYWHARSAFDALLAAAARIRKGDLSATPAYRSALGELRTRATAVLADAGHAATAATVQRVTGTLAAVAAAGGFDPDPPGALGNDLEPPGFDALAGSGLRAHQQPRGPSPRHGPAVRIEVSGRKRVAAAEAQERAQKQAQEQARERAHERARERAQERAKEQAERKARAAERLHLTTALRDAKAALQARERASLQLHKDLRAADEAVKDARDAVRDLERKLADLAATD